MSLWVLQQKIGVCQKLSLGVCWLFGVLPMFVGVCIDRTRANTESDPTQRCGLRCFWFSGLLLKCLLGLSETSFGVFLFLECYH